jgi:hypothetical protein
VTNQHSPACLLQALISALGNQWEKAIEVFREQEEAARQDPDCVPNTITYSVRPAAARRAHYAIGMRPSLCC